MIMHYIRKEKLRMEIYHLKMCRSDIIRTVKKMSLSNISFDVKAGQTLGIIGPTGSGKTTLVSLYFSSL